MKILQLELDFRLEKEPKDIIINETVVEEKPVEERSPKIDLTILTVFELKELAKKKEIKGYSKMKKEELIEALK